MLTKHVWQTRRSEASGNQGSEIKKNNFVLQPISTISAPQVQELIQVIDGECSNQLPYGHLGVLTRRSRQTGS